MMSSKNGMVTALNSGVPQSDDLLTSQSHQLSTSCENMWGRAEQWIVDRAIEKVKFIMERIDARHPVSSV